MTKKIPTSRPTLNDIKEYVPGRSIQEVQRQFGIQNLIKMASNENPLGCAIKNPDKLFSSIQNGYYYPSYSTSGLIERLAQALSIKKEQLIIGNGSDEIISLLGFAYLNPKDEVISAQETFSEYEFISRLMDATFTTVPLKHYHFDLESIAARISKRTKLIFIANPNNPTGTIVPHAQLVSFLKTVPSHIIVVLDEAYYEYAQSPDFPKSINLLKQWPNLVVLRTFSKIYGLAGFRIGYGISAPAIISQLNKVKPPFNISSISEKAAELALYETDFVKKSIEINEQGKQFLYKALQELNLEYVKTEANFILIQLPISAHVVWERLIYKGFIVRPLASYGYPNAIRVTIGTPDQNRALVDAFRSVLEEE